MAYSLTQINQMSQAEFTAALGAVFEETPAIAFQAWPQRPFASVEALHQAMVSIVQAMPKTDQQQIIDNHPDLGRRAQMAEASVQEQRGAGLDHLSAADHQQLLSLNQRYRDKFGFPFIMAVANQNLASILAGLHQRLDNDPTTERSRALEEIYQIAYYRLQAWISPQEI